MCTANQCRSPLAAAIAVRALDERGVAAIVRSAGTDALDGAPATEAVVRAAARSGLDLSEHGASHLDTETVQAADLILVMEPRHIVEVVQVHDGRLDRTFTVPELATVFRDEAGATTGPDRASARPWPVVLDEVATRRDVAAALGAPSVTDPTGRSGRAHRATVAELVDLVATIADGLAAAGPAEDGPAVNSSVADEAR